MSYIGLKSFQDGAVSVGQTVKIPEDAPSKNYKGKVCKVTALSGTGKRTVPCGFHGSHTIESYTVTVVADGQEPADITFSSKKDELNVVVATASVIKLGAVCDALFTFDDGLHELMLFSSTPPSQVSDQPIGIEETTRGALNRIAGCVKDFTKEVNKGATDLIVAVENGMVPLMPGHYMDTAVVAMQRMKDGEVFFATSSGVMVKYDGDDVRAYAAKLSKECNKDVHNAFSGGAVTRLQTINQATHLALGQLRTNGATAADAASAPAASGGESGGKVAELEAQVAAQGNKVRQLKADKAPKAEVKKEVAVLLKLKEELAAAQS